MAEGSTENRRLTTVVALVLTIAVCMAMAYLGIRLGGIGAYVLTEGEVLLGTGSLLIGIALIGVPVAILVSQLRAVFRRRG